MKTRTNTDALSVPLHRLFRPDAAQIGFCGCEYGLPVFVGVKNSKSKKHRCFHAWTECCGAALDNDPESMTADGCVKYSTHYSAAVRHAMRYFNITHKVMDTAPSQPELTMDAPAVFHAPPGSPCGGMGGHHSARADKDEWLTPPELLRALGDFDLDPCSPVNRPWPTAARHLTWQDNGLLAEWKGRVWCNPPYGREAGRWLARCAEHGNATALIFARTETADWQAHVWAKADAILFLYGRLHFHHVDGRRAAANSGAPSALISYNAENTRFLENSQLPGRLIRLANQELTDK